MNVFDFPEHKVSLTLEHNPGRVYYDNVRQWINLENYGAQCDWKNDEQKQRAIATDEVWTLNWYPRTPVSSYSIAAPTLRELLEFAAEVDLANTRLGNDRR
jgi:hypothetical protein